ncbi:MAG: hypothetical protein EAZ69_16340 [Oscillatoriales cyanobacterium]|nr:MAG: hypothetical protein EAZ69_16340 [Oscillatoriales cyanobacterium]
MWIEANPRNRVSADISRTQPKLSQKPGFSPRREFQKPGFFRYFSYSTEIVAETRFLETRFLATHLIPETGFLPIFFVLNRNCRRNPVSRRSDWVGAGLSRLLVRVRYGL